jgi:hypothetical protein
VQLKPIIKGELGKEATVSLESIQQSLHGQKGEEKLLNLQRLIDEQVRRTQQRDVSPNNVENIDPNSYKLHNFKSRTFRNINAHTKSQLEKSVSQTRQSAEVQVVQSVKANKTKVEDLTS